MNVLVVSGATTRRAECVSEGWRRAAPTDRLRTLHLPETVPEASHILGVADSAALDPEAALDAIARGALIAIGQREVHDAGRAVLEAARQRYGGLEQARSELAGARVLSDDSVALRGLRGAGARRASVVGDAAALDEDRVAGEYADSIEKELARRDLLDNRPVRWSLEPYSGAGGGIGFALLALGATIEHVRDAAADMLGVGQAVAESDLVVLVMGELGVDELNASIATAVAGAAIEAAIPVIAIVTEDHTSRRQRADLGIVGTYSAGDVLTEVTSLAERVARTWSVSN